MSLDDTLDNLNSTMERVADLLKTVELAVLIIAIALAILMIGSVATCYYSKYKKYSMLRPSDDADRSSSTYAKSPFHDSNL